MPLVEWWGGNSGGVHGDKPRTPEPRKDEPEDTTEEEREKDG